MDEKESWGLTEEEIKQRLRQQSQENSKRGSTRGGRSSGQGVKLLYIRDYLYTHAAKEHPTGVLHSDGFESLQCEKIRIPEWVSVFFGRG